MKLRARHIVFNCGCELLFIGNIPRILKCCEKHRKQFPELVEELKIKDHGG